jgi:hypothetical protein
VDFSLTLLDKDHDRNGECHDVACDDRDQLWSAAE